MKQLNLLFLLLLIGFTTTKAAQNALHFDGSNDFVQTTFPGIFGTANRTFEAWVKVDVGASASNLCILDFGTNAVGSRNTFSVGGNRNLGFISGGTNANMGSAGSVITEGQWTHVAFVLDNGNGYVYVNGVQVGTGLLTTVNTPVGNQNLSIGQRVPGGSIPFEGAIDEVRIWNYARTATEIANNQNAEFCSLPAGLVAYYTFNQGVANGNNSSVSSLYDAVQNANGTLTNFSLSGTTSNWVAGPLLTPGLTLSRNQETVCDSMISPSGLSTWTKSGIFYDTINNTNSCDSIMRFNLTVNKSKYDVLADTTCEPYVSPSGNYTFTTSGQYYDTTLTASGCQQVYELNLSITIIDTNVSRNGNTLTAIQANATYDWLDCDDAYAIITGTKTQSFTPTSNGNFAVRIRRGDCVDTSTCQTVNWVGISELPLSRIRFYPNPSNGTVTVDMDDYFTGSILVRNMQGQVVYEGIIVNQQRYNLSIDVPKGCYFAELRGNGITSNKRILVQ